MPRGRLVDELFLGDRGGVGRGEADDDQHEGGQHQDIGDDLPPFRLAPGLDVVGRFVGGAEPDDAADGGDREGDHVGPITDGGDDAVAQGGASDADMDGDEEQAGEQQ